MSWWARTQFGLKEEQLRLAPSDVTGPDGRLIAAQPKAGFCVVINSFCAVTQTDGVTGIVILAMFDKDPSSGGVPVPIWPPIGVLTGGAAIRPTVDLYDWNIRMPLGVQPYLQASSDGPWPVEIHLTYRFERAFK